MLEIIIKWTKRRQWEGKHRFIHKNTQLAPYKAWSIVFGTDRMFARLDLQEFFRDCLEGVFQFTIDDCDKKRKGIDSFEYDLYLSGNECKV